MIGVDDIADIIKIALYSGCVEGELPLSLLLISSVGSGKTELLSRTQGKTSVKKIKIGKGKNERIVDTRQIDGSVLYTTSTTPYILYTRYGSLLKSGQIKHVVIPDFLNILNLPTYQMKTVVGFYNSLIEEGIISIESRDGSFVAELPVRIGLMTGVARQDYYKRKDEIAAIGFSSRTLKVSWSYSDGTKKRIKDSASAREYLQDTTRYEIALPPPTQVTLPEKWADIIQEMADRVRDPADDLGVRSQKQLQRFLMGNALMSGRTEVNGDDIKKLRKYEKYFNDKCVAEV